MGETSEQTASLKILYNIFNRFSYFRILINLCLKAREDVVNHDDSISMNEEEYF